MEGGQNALEVATLARERRLRNSRYDDTTHMDTRKKKKSLTTWTQTPWTLDTHTHENLTKE